MDEQLIKRQQGKCDYKQGAQPSCGVLSAAYIPFQGEDFPKYASEEALTRGTLFPGLDLPWHNIANKTNPYANTPLGDLMAVDFVVYELKLYLDTHKNDTEAFELYKSFLELAEEGRKKYVKCFGPISQSDMRDAKSYTWICDPWPWEYAERTGG